MDGYWDTLAWVLVVKVKSMDDILLRANLDFTKVERSFLRRHEKTIGVDAGDVADLAVDFKSFKTFQVFEVLPDSTPYST